MADVYFENSEIRIGVNNHGAELVSLVRKSDGREYMWSGDPAYWGRVSPVLFPFVGKLKNTSYKVNGVTFEGVPQHGYARDTEFALVETTEDAVYFECSSDDVWKSRYPYDFVLRIGYRLEGNSVHVIWNVKNTSKSEMHFSIGAHPAFIIPNGDSKVGYAADLHIAADSITSGELNDKGLLKPETKEIALKAGKLTLTEELFDQDALILDSDNIHEVSLETPEGEAFLSVKFDTPQLGIWSPVGKKAPFVCIEPWYGRSDRVEFDGDLSEREYGNTIGAGETFEREYVIGIL